MLDVGGVVFSIFGPYGAAGLLLCVMIIFIIDALIMPTLPELFTVIAYMYDPSPEWALMIMATILIGEFIGMTSLYLIVERITVPRRIRSIATRYVNFLIIGDEKLLLVNRFAPMVPFAGAFVSMMDGWTYSRALKFLLTGAFIKYGLILIMSGFFFRLFSGPEAQFYTLLFVAAFIIISLVYGWMHQRGIRKTAS